MRSLRIVLASLILALYWWVNPHKKPGPRRGTRKAKQDALMADLAVAWKANGPDSTPSPLAEAPVDVDQFSPEVVSGV